MELTKKFSMVLLSLVTALALCLGMVTTTAFAATGDATAAISKQLKVADGTSLPTAGITFTFDFAKETGIKDPSDKVDVRTDGPAVPSTSATVTSASKKKTATGVTTYTQETPIIALDVTKFPGAGVYAYKVTEKNPAAYAADPLYNETITYDTGFYIMYVWVKNGEDGKPVIDDITFEDEDGNKVDGTPGGNDPTGGIDGDGDKILDSSGVFFENTYVKSKTGPVDPTDLDTYTLDVNKTVTGDLGNRTLPFEFSITVNKPALAGATETTFKAVKVNADGTKTNVEITYGTAYAFTLKHGEKLLLGDAYIGSTYDVSETAVTDYATSSIITTGGLAAGKTGAIVAGQKVSDTGANIAAYTNAYMDVTPTGIVTNNLPFFMLILVAIGGLGAFVAVRSRKSNN